MKTTLEQGEPKQAPRRFAPRNDRMFFFWSERAGLWTQVWATAGATAWAGVAVLARIGIARVGAIELMFLFAPLVIVPLGMELGRIIGKSGRLEDLARQLQPLGAGLAVAAIWMPPGRNAGLAASGWLVVCGMMAAGGIVDLFQELRGRVPLLPISGSSGAPRFVGTRESPVPTLFRAALAIAKIDLAVGGAWFVASRLGMRPMGIQEPIGLLTAVHFHYAGFATATIAPVTLRFAARHGRQRWLKPVVAAVVALPFVVAIGFVVSPALKMAAGVLFSASVAGLAVYLRDRGRQAANTTARVLLQVASVTVFAGMVLSGTYAVADFLGSDLLTIPQMARTHGILNGVGFCLTGLLGWLVESSAQNGEQEA